MEKLTSQDMFAWVMVTLVILQSFSTVYTARKNARALREEKNAPMVSLEKRLAKVEAHLDNDYLRFEHTERDLLNFKSGLQVICHGVLALLNHELHDGNSDEIQAALKGLNEWMLGR